MEFVRTEPGADPIVVECYFAATPATVFQAWTDPKVVVKWFGHTPYSLHSATIDLRPGGAWQFLKSKDDKKSVGFEGEYLVIEPGERLIFSWSQVVAYADGKREATPPSQVEIVFTAKGNGTDLRLVHTAVHSEEARRGFAGGWNRAFGLISALFNDSEGGA